MTDAQRKNLRDLLLAARHKARLIHAYTEAGKPRFNWHEGLMADLNTALDELHEMEVSDG